MVVGGFYRIFSEDLFISTYRNKARITCVYTINLLVREFCFGETLAGLDEPTKMFPVEPTKHQGRPQHYSIREMS